MRAATLALAALLVACGGAASPGATTPEEAQRGECTAALRFEEPVTAGAADEETPRTRVTLVLICEDEPLRSAVVGDEIGACFSEEASGGEMLRARCWWAGQGAILVVREREGVLEVLRSALDEQTGAGELRRVNELKLPANHTVHAL